MPNGPREIREALDTGRGEFDRQSRGVIERIRIFTEATGRALGEISRDEAVDALRKYAVDEIEKLR